MRPSASLAPSHLISPTASQTDETNNGAEKRETDGSLTDIIPYEAVALGWECEKCRRLYHDRERFELHVKRHVNENTFKCQSPACGNTYPDKASLKAHMRRHSMSNRPFKCSHEGCGSAFLTAYHLHRHTLTHTGERPFRCPYKGCGMRFALKYRLKEHERARHKR